ncbi:MAG: Lrp/AsnC family transcriptional regulator [Kordiimonadaceae bacterium]|nr:Lrp/AsnC family transcriptional regulator [Kordiimonadaceae bacterium]MBO6567691.1 Lrp/AsnC family transcriptional regulator [Kordiimonadaceae bacterium]MBO6963095.1 Lrp/AsnC family transcriptional regulator [Kordiimonadaceae bacterium]
MDETDKKLVDVLRDNARISLSSLSRVLGLSRSTVQDRISKLENRGVIAGYTVRLRQDIAAREIRAQVMLKIVPKALDDVVSFCRRQNAVTALHTISGEYDMAAMLRAETTAELDDAIDAIALLKGVERTQTSVILSTKLERAT